MSFTFDEVSALLFDPFTGDFPDLTYRPIKNKIGTARKPGPCFSCGGQISQGDRIRMMTGFHSYGIISHRFCPQCCFDFAESINECPSGSGYGQCEDDL
jgi:hypothetical protein